MSRLQRRIVSETRAALEPLGYYEPEVTYDVDARAATTWRVTIHVTPGRPVRLSEVTIDVTAPGENERAMREVIEAQDLKPGLRLNHGTYERVKGALLRAAKNDGYLDARLTKNELVIDRAGAARDCRRSSWTPASATATARSRSRRTSSTTTRCAGCCACSTGDPYTLDSLLRTQYVLDDSQYFSAVDIESGDADRAARTVPITITRGAEPPSIASPPAWATAPIPRRAASSRGTTVASIATAIASSSSCSARRSSRRSAARYVDSGDGHRARETRVHRRRSVEEELGDTLSQRAEVGAGLTQVLGRWQRVLFLRLLERDHDRRRRADATPTFYAHSRHQLLDAAELHRRRQARGLTACTPSCAARRATLGSDASFLQLRLQGERVFDLSRALASASCAPSSARPSSSRADFSNCRRRSASSPAATAACAASR